MSSLPQSIASVQSSQWTNSSQLCIHLLSEKDAVAAFQISSKLHWGNTVENWQQDISSSKVYAFGITHLKSDGKELIATAVAVPFENKIRMMDILVHADYQRQGFGKTLFKRLLKSISTLKSPCIELEASSLGKPMYEQFGFKVDYEVSSFSKKIDKDASRAQKTVEIPSISQEQLNQVIELDRKAFGASRANLISHLYKGHQIKILVDQIDEIVRGFLIYQKDNNGIAIGSWVHMDSEKTGGLLEKAVRLVSQEYPGINISVVTANSVAMQILEKNGFIQGNFSTYHMHVDDNKKLEANQNYYAIWSFGNG